MTTDVDLTERERAVVNAFQGGFPVVKRPFEPAAAAMRDRGVDISASELLETIRELDDEGVLSRFGPLVNAQEIGGAATLVAMHAPEDRFDEIVEQVNAHREVAHNYERAHPHLNVWFVVSVADEDRVEDVLAEIEAETGQETYNLPKQREFRVEAKFYVDGPLDGSGADDIGIGNDSGIGDNGTHDNGTGDGNSTSENATAGVDCTDLGLDVTPTDASTLSPAERDLVLEIQDGFTLCETPYADVADAIDQDLEWVLETIKRFEQEGKIRRIGVVPNHYALGYTENGMTVWNVPDDLVSEVGPEIAALPFVTHCYQRPRHEGVWPYNFFAMTHGRSEAESQRRIEQVRDQMEAHWDVTDDDWDSLFSTQILKKTGIRMDERAEANTEST